jgi:hypothetical protein
MKRLICFFKGHDKVFMPEEQFEHLAMRLRTIYDGVPWACKRCRKHPWWMYWWNL